MNLDIGAVITLCLFMVVHLCGTVWWMSKVNATLGFIGTQINDVMKTVANHEAKYATKEDVAKEMGHLQKSLDAIWEKFDTPHACANTRCNK